MARISRDFAHIYGIYIPAYAVRTRTVPGTRRAIVICYRGFAQNVTNHIQKIYTNIPKYRWYVTSGKGNMGYESYLLLTPIPRPSKFKLLLKNIYDR